MKHLLLLVTSIAVISCSKNNNNDDDTKNGSGLKIVGKTVQSTTKSVLSKASATPTLQDAKYVILFHYGGYKIYDIVNGSFTLEPEFGTGVALLFLDQNSKYIGNLSAEGLNILPLGVLSNGKNTTIDLGMLTLDGTTVIPSHDPLGKEIIISQAEINILKAAGAFYEYIASNIDLDKNGVPDILSQTEIRVASQYIIGNCGYFSNGSKQPVLNDKSQFVIYSGIVLTCGISRTFSTVGFSGPLSAPYSNIKAGYNISEGENRYIIGVTREATNTFLGLPFIQGTYILKLDNKDYQIEYSNNDPYASLIIVVPTVHYDSNGIFTYVSLEYKSLDGSVITNPANLILNMNGNIGNTLEQGTKLYNNFKQDGVNHYDMIGPPSDVKLDISAGVKYVEINYQDLFGNGYILAYPYKSNK